MTEIVQTNEYSALIRIPSASNNNERPESALQDPTLECLIQAVSRTNQVALGKILALIMESNKKLPSEEREKRLLEGTNLRDRIFRALDEVKHCLPLPPYHS